MLNKLGLGLPRSKMFVSGANLFKDASFAYSLHDLGLGAISVVRVRRDSDNTEQDFTATEITDGTLDNFLNGANAFVSKLYNQTGGGNATQSSASLQPSIENGNISYTDDYLEIPDSDDLSFTDGVNNTDFVIVGEFIFNTIKNSTLIGKRGNNVPGNQREWLFRYDGSSLDFFVFDLNGSNENIKFNFTPVLGQKYVLGVTMNNNVLNLFIDGSIVQTYSLSSGFNLINGQANVLFGNDIFVTSNNFEGKIKEVRILKNQGWNATDVSDYFNTTQNQNTQTLDLFVELGQSNMRGRDGDDANADYPFISNKGYWWDGSEEHLIRTDRGDVLAGEGSHANYFCEKYFDLSQRKAVMIYAAKGDTGLTSISKPDPNNWSATGDLRGIAEARTDAAIAYYGKQPTAALWCQGERDARQMQSDPSYTKAQIKTAMQDVIDWWQTKYPTAAFFISELGDEDPPEGTGEFQIVRDVQNEIVAENTNVFMAYTGAKTFPSLGFMSDDIHYSFEGYKLMGEAFAVFVDNEINN